VAFCSLYAEHRLTLLRLATVLSDDDRGRAEDLVQETMLRAWTHRAKLDIQHHSPRAWLITVVRHLAVDAHRARRARPPEAELDDDLALADGQRADASIDEAGVRAAMAALPAPQRQVLAEVYYRDRSVAETARILQIPPGTVRSRTFYGLRALRRSLAAQMRWPSPLRPSAADRIRTALLATVSHDLPARARTPGCRLGIPQTRTLLFQAEDSRTNRKGRPR
jgi:RNA polymerase sigma-70 factor (ECF subfamily)